jgi:outer membrane protein assembly factor BamB
MVRASVATATTFLFFLGAQPLTAASGAPWSRFRGPNGTGVAETGSLPAEFGPARNVVWKTILPPGHSSPNLWENRIFLTAVEDKTLFTYCIDRSTGAILWRREAPRDREEKLDVRNNAASPSPAVDAQGVYVFFPDFGILAYDLEGREKWRLALGPFNNIYGMGASPVVVEDLVVLVCDQNTGSFIIAVGKDDGRVRWKMERPEATSGHSTPVVYQPPGGPAELLVPGSFLLTSYAARSGEKVWWVRGLSFEMKSTPVLAGGMVYINGYATPLNQPDAKVAVAAYEKVRPQWDADGDGRFSPAELADETAKTWFAFTDLNGDGALDQGEWSYYRAAMATTNALLAIKAGGRGDVSEGAIRWQNHRSVPQLPSPLLYRDVLYMINDKGIVTTFRPDSGKVIAYGRLEGAIDNYFASPIGSDGKVFMVSESGKVVVLGSDGSLDPIAVNDLDDVCHATPAIADGRIYLRTRSTLYSFGLPRPEEATLRRCHGLPFQPPLPGASPP